MRQLFKFMTYHSAQTRLVLGSHLILLGERRAFRLKEICLWESHCSQDISSQNGHLRHRQRAIRLKGYLKLGMVVQRVALLPHSSRLPGSIMCSGYSLGGVSQILVVFIQVSFLLPKSCSTPSVPGRVVAPEPISLTLGERLEHPHPVLDASPPQSTTYTCTRSITPRISFIVGMMRKCETQRSRSGLNRGSWSCGVAAQSTVPSRHTSSLICLLHSM